MATATFLSSRSSSCSIDFHISPEAKKNLVIAAKVMVIALVIAGLITASIFTGGLAMAAITAGASGMVTGACIGGCVGFGLTALAAPLVAIDWKMYDYVKDENLKNTACYVGVMALGILYGVGYCIVRGIEYGFWSDCINGMGRRR